VHLLNDKLGLGLTMTTYIMGIFLAVLLVAQFSLRRYVPAVYWSVVVLLSVVGTLITDNLTDNFKIPLATTTPIFSMILAVVFGVWYASERTLSIHSIVTMRRETFYWLAVLFTFALGTAAGDLISKKFDLGYVVATLLFAAAIAVFALARRRGGQPGVRVLGGLHPHPPPGCIHRRPARPAPAGRRARTGTAEDQRRVPARHHRADRLCDAHPDRRRRTQALTAVLPGGRL
jgi:hypothetical protein